MDRSWRKLFLAGASLLSISMAALGGQAMASTVCSSGCDFTTIQGAIDAASEYEEVVVSPGTYYENIVFPAMALISVSSSGGPDGTIIDGSNNPGQPVVSFSAYSYYQFLTGFTITNGDAPQGGGVFIAGGCEPQIRDCIITGNHAEKGGGIYHSNNSYATFKDCVITNNTADIDGGGIYNMDASHLSVAYSTISNNTATTGAGGGIASSEYASGDFENSIITGNSAGTSGGGIASDGWTYLANSIVSQNSATISGGGIASVGMDYTELWHCTITDNSAGSSGGVAVNEFAMMEGANNILWFNSPDQASSGESSSLSFYYSDVQGGLSDYDGTNITNIDCDPQFVGRDNLDLHLSPESCCIDAGDGTFNEILVDLEGNSRPSGLGFDIGAYEMIYQVPVCNDLDGDGVTDCDGDCNDNDSSIFPGAAEKCDGLDNNCDGVVPSNEVDADNDGFMGCQECNDSNPDVFPGAAELCDGLDNNCDGVVPSNEVDADNDGFMGCQECNDSDSTVYPGAAEVCNNGIDDNCDGSADCADGSCSDFCSQPQPEICYDGIDNDLDGKTDCADKKDCNKDPVCTFTAPVDPEICNDGIDNDGDGKTDCADKKDCRKDPAC